MAHIPKSAYAAVFAAVLATAIAAGCLPSGKTGAAPAIDTDAPDAQTAFWRAQYLKNRSVPPREFSVAPKPPRNNDFGEFDDSLYTGLDSQPALPGLPGEDGVMAMMGGMTPPEYRFEDEPAQQPGTGRRFTSSPVARPRETAPAAKARAQTGAGIDAAGHFYPVEQLVFGGDYPDIDKPELYRLMPRDAVTVTVRDHPEFSGKVEIQADGTVRIANTPDLIRLRGLAVEEAAEEIRRTLQPYVKGECVVRVQANRARGGYYFVFGDVNQPGRFPMGLEPIRLSDAILAANWETNPNRMNEDDELGPAFPAAGARGRFVAPQSADLARVMLITPHRSQPVRTSHDIRSAMLGMTANDPVVRPGQIIVVPSLDPQKNRAIGLAMPEGFGTTPPPEAPLPGRGFSGADSAARLPDIAPDSHPARQKNAVSVPAVERNLTSAYAVQSTTLPYNPNEEEEIIAEAEAGVVETETVEVETVETTETTETTLDDSVWFDPLDAVDTKANPEPEPESEAFDDFGEFEDPESLFTSNGDGNADDAEGGWFSRRRGRKLKRRVSEPRETRTDNGKKSPGNASGWSKGL